VKRQREDWAYKRDGDSIQTGTTFGYWIITGVLDLGYRSGLSWWKAKT
jgi:hypothetical protein